MPRLILLNGPPACGKSTLARRYAHEHPLTLALDIDVVRDLIGDWRAHPGEAGLLARSVALAAARVHLLSGHDVVVPQLLARPDLLDRAAALAGELGCAYHEVALLDSKENSVRRYLRRAGTGGDDARQQGEPAELEALYDRLTALLAERPATPIIRIHDGEVDRAYRDLLAVLGPG